MNFSADELEETLNLEAISLDPEPPQMILSTNKNIPNLTLKITASPQLSGNLDKVYLSFNLIVEHLHEEPRQVSISEDIIQSALMKKRDVIVAAVFSQQGWLSENCPLAADEILKVYNNIKLPAGTSGGGARTL